MKKIILLIALIAITTISIKAEDLSVLDIPLQGTIGSFTAKIKKQGYKISSESKNLPVGQRCFEVRFAGEDAILLVSYDKETKMIYDCILTFSSFQKEDLKSKFELFKKQISNKYTKKGCKVTAQCDNFRNMPMWRFSIDSKNNTPVGKIFIYYWDIPADEHFDTIYQLNIRYRSKDAPTFNDEYMNLY